MVTIDDLAEKISKQTGLLVTVWGFPKHVSVELKKNAGDAEIALFDFERLDGYVRLQLAQASETLTYHVKSFIKCGQWPTPSKEYPHELLYPFDKAGGKDSCRSLEIEPV